MVDIFIIMVLLNLIMQKGSNKRLAPRKYKKKEVIYIGQCNLQGDLFS
jgi:hypothetical protein